MGYQRSVDLEIKLSSHNFSQNTNDNTNLFFYPEIGILIPSFKYSRVVRIEKQIGSFVFWEKLRLDNFISRSTDLSDRTIAPGSASTVFHIIEI